jgi:arylsulfatase A-like enzyme
MRMERATRTLRDVLAIGVLAGLVAGAAAGALDALWSWSAAAQFVAHVGARVRFVAYTALSHAAAGALVGLVVAVAFVVIARGTRMGELVRFMLRTHTERRTRDPRDAVVGLAFVLAGAGSLAVAIAVVYGAMTPVVVASHVLGLAVLATIAATLAALVVAAVVTFVLARLFELGLRPLAARVRIVSSPRAPAVALFAIVAVAAAAWAWHDWATVKLLHLRGEVVLAVAAVLALPALVLARRLAAVLARLPPWPRRGVWVAWPLALAVAVLATGGSAQVIKAASAYTGLGGPIARELRRVFDRDHDGYSRFLGGGDCDDSDPTVHPGAPEIPDDGIDQNCVGGDANTKAPREDIAWQQPPPSVPAGFNVLLLTIDTTRADHLGAYGSTRPTSPNLDKLAADGTLFVNGWAHAPSTRYSMPAILTGRFPLDVYYDMTQWWPGSIPSARSRSRSGSAASASGAITNFDYFDPKRHMNLGVTEYDNEDARLHQAIGGPERSHGSSSKQQTDKAIAYVDRHAADRWFLWVHYYDPHADYEPHPEVPSFGSDDMALYDGEIRFTDLHIGRLLDELRAKGLYDKTVIVVTGDHGEGFGEHGVDHHGFHLYVAQTKVPMIMRVPGLAPRRSLTPAGHVDIMPTLVDLAGGQPSKDMEGRSLVDVLAGAPDRDRVVYQQLSFENNNEKRGGASQRCHVIYNVSPDTSWEVYRLDRDPNEGEDLSDDDDPGCTDTRHAIEQRYDLETVPAGAAEALLDARPAIASPLDADLGESVRLLAVDAPARAHPGDAIDLTWTFEARGRVAPGWKMFVHLQGPNGAFFNGDHAPTRPFEWWRAGQFIRYTTTLAIPRTAPAGRYTLRAGMYSGDRRARASAPHAAVDHDEVDVATIEVAP